jgi:hypothetical protein
MGRDAAALPCPRPTRHLHRYHMHGVPHVCYTSVPLLHPHTCRAGCDSPIQCPTVPLLGFGTSALWSCPEDPRPQLSRRQNSPVSLRMLFAGWSSTPPHPSGMHVDEAMKSGGMPHGGLVPKVANMDSHMQVTRTWSECGRPPPLACSQAKLPYFAMWTTCQDCQWSIACGCDGK